MSRYKKVIFVSTNGTCRSLWAKAIFNQLNTDTNIGAEARGYVVLFEEPANPKAVAIGKTKNLILDKEMSKALTKEDFGDDVLMLVMTDLLKMKIYEDFENAVNVYSLREFTKEAIDVEAAYGGELPEYGEHFEYLYKLVVEVIGLLNNDENDK